METPVTAISDVSSAVLVDQNHNTLVSDLPNHDHGSIESKDEFSKEEVRIILEVIAANGKFWHDWDKLKGMLSFYLKQILSEYPEAKMTSDEQISSLGETYPELVKRLDDVLHNFIEGPPFTLQRLSEILLAAQSIYSKLSKLALALEKNLLVASTLTICTDPYPSAMVQILDQENSGEEASFNEKKETDETLLQSNAEQNGVEPMAVDGEEVVMQDLKTNIENDMMLDMSAYEDLVGRPVDPVPPQTGEL